MKYSFWNNLSTYHSRIIVLEILWIPCSRTPVQYFQSVISVMYTICFWKNYFGSQCLLPKHVPEYMFRKNVSRLQIPITKSLPLQLNKQDNNIFPYLLPLSVLNNFNTATSTTTPHWNSSLPSLNQ